MSAAAGMTASWPFVFRPVTSALSDRELVELFDKEFRSFVLARVTEQKVASGELATADAPPAGYARQQARLSAALVAEISSRPNADELWSRAGCGSDVRELLAAAL